MYLKRGKENTLDANGQPTPWDPEYLWGVNEKGEVGLAQRYVFDPITLPVQSFLRKNYDHWYIIIEPAMATFSDSALPEDGMVIF